MLVILFSTIFIVVPSLAAAGGTPAIGDPNSLSAYIYNLSSSALMRSNHKTGVLYNVSVTDLPPPLNAMQVSVIRLRSSNLWARGLHESFESFDIPPRITTRPYVERVDIIFSNLGKNLSSRYYDLPAGYTIITSVTSFLAYASPNANNNKSTAATSTPPPRPPPLLNLSVRGEPIKVKFSNLLIDRDRRPPLGKKKCLRFDPSGSVELSDMAVGDDQENVCSSHAQGHFAIAIPSSPPLPVKTKKKKKKKRKNIKLWKWWLIGFVGGLIGLMLAGLVGFFLYKAYRVREFKRMEKKSERSESLGSTWINGASRMPSASFTRTEAASSMEDECFS